MFNYQFSELPKYLEILKQKLNLAVIYGGNKDEENAVIYKTHNPRSTKTYERVAYDIAEALKQLGFKNIYVMSDNMSLSEKLRQNKIHLAWLNTAGVQGYNPVCHTPALLEMLGIPYIGHNPLNSSILDNKHSFKRELQGLDYSTAPFIICHPSQGKFNPYLNQRFQKIFADYNGTFIVKPVSGRASLNVEVVDNIKDLSDVVTKIQAITHNTVLIEKFLSGREFCVSVCGYVRYSQNQFLKEEKPFTFSIFERILESDEKIFTSMDTKVITADRISLLTNPQDLGIKEELKNLAQQIYLDFNLNTLIRIDLRSDEQGQLYILEANPKPDLKKPSQNVTSIVAQGLDEYKMTYEDLIFSLFGDRLDYLFTYHTHIIQHIIDLLNVN